MFHFVLQISQPPKVAQKWFCIQNVHMDLSFQQKKTAWNSVIWFLRYISKTKSFSCWTSFIFMIFLGFDSKFSNRSYEKNSQSIFSAFFSSVQIFQIEKGTLIKTFMLFWITFTLYFNAAVSQYLHIPILFYKFCSLQNYC